MSPTRNDSKLHEQLPNLSKQVVASEDAYASLFAEGFSRPMMRPGWSLGALSASGTPGVYAMEAIHPYQESRKPFPDRRILRPTIKQFPPSGELEEWARRLGLEKVLGPLILIPVDRLRVLQLLYQYKHLNGEDLINLPCTDLITHRVRITLGTKPFAAKSQKRWLTHTEWWMQKLVTDGLLGGVYELTEAANGRLF